MASFDDRKADASATLADLKNSIAAKIAIAEQQAAARVADAEKKLQDAAESAVPLDELNAWFGDFLAEIKGVLE
jgi:hypothetical protein